MKQGPSYKTYKDDERHPRKRESVSNKKDRATFGIICLRELGGGKIYGPSSVSEKKRTRKSEENKEQKRRSNHHHYTNDMIFSFIQMINEEKKSKT